MTPARQRILTVRDRLGVDTDAAVAAELGVSRPMVQRVRASLGICAAAPSLAARGIAWDSEPLGQVPDRQIAARLGVSKASVAMARARRGIPRPLPPFDWDAVAHRLGTVPDQVLADELGMSRTVVLWARRRRGIPAFGKRP